MPGAGGVTRHKTHNIFFQDLSGEKFLSALPKGETVPCAGNDSHEHAAGDDRELFHEAEVAPQSEEHDNREYREDRAHRSFSESGETKQKEENERLHPTHCMTTVE